MVYHRSDRSSSANKRPVNAFANDGSFLEMFKRLQEQQGGEGGSDASSSDGNKSSVPSPTTATEPKEGTSVDKKDSSTSELKPGTSSKPFFVGKRRGGRFLATGMVKKRKLEGQEEEEAPPKDAWSLYLAEVKKYKQTTCEEEGKTRPLVK